MKIKLISSALTFGLLASGASAAPLLSQDFEAGHTVNYSVPGASTFRFGDTDTSDY